jgi:dTDP-4-amino-4,6-dideoxygalactose transaminase
VNPELAQPIATQSTLDSIQNHAFHLYVVRTTQRKDLQRHLQESGVQTLIHYPIPPHKQQAYQGWSQQEYPLTESIHQQALSLPISPVMSDEQVQQVINACNIFAIS